MLITVAPSLRNNSGAMRRHRSRTATRSVWITVVSSSRVWSSIGPSSHMPALLTSMSSRPNRSAIVAASASRCSGVATSPARTMEPDRSASCSSRAARLAVITTSAPAPRRVSANRSPRPDEAPVRELSVPTESPSRHCCIGIIPCVHPTSAGSQAPSRTALRSNQAAARTPRRLGSPLLPQPRVVPVAAQRSNRNGSPVPFTADVATGSVAHASSSSPECPRA